jgi:hypothetical protein
MHFAMPEESDYFNYVRASNPANRIQENRCEKKREDPPPKKIER